MGKIFSGDIKSHLLAFLSAKADSHADDVAMLQGIAKENKGKMLFVTINTDEDDHKRILEFFGITESELPPSEPSSWERTWLSTSLRTTRSRPRISRPLLPSSWLES